MNIHENTALLNAFLDGELTDEELAAVQAHLSECPECRTYVDDILAIRADFPSGDEPELPADFTDTVMRAVAKAPQSRPKKQPWGKLAAAAACLALIVLVQHGALNSVASSSARDTAAANCNTAESAPASQSADSPSASDEAGDISNDSADAHTNSDTAKAQTAGTPDSHMSRRESVREVDSSSAPVAVEPQESADLPTVYLSAADIGDLLNDREPAEQEDSGTKRYLLTREELDTLANTLEKQGVTLEIPDADSSQFWLEIFN